METTLQLSLQHEQDLAISAAAYVAANPSTSQAGFKRWVTSVRAFERYPELRGLDVVEVIPAAELPAAVARIVADPPHPLRPDGVFTIVPPGMRPFYCLGVASASRRSEGIPAGLDFCAVHENVVVARDSGTATYDPLPGAKNTGLGIGVPVYRGGLVPATVTARRRAFLGSVDLSLVPAIVLDRALAAHPGITVAMRYHRNGSAVRFTSGVLPPHATATNSEILGGWTVTTFGVVAGAGVLAHRDAVVLLVSGLVLSGLLGLLVFVLGTGRARALGLVTERTGELSATLSNLQVAQQERARLLARTVEIAEAERNSIAADLHDGPIQNLTAVATSLDLLGSRLEREEHDAAVSLAEEIRQDIAGQMGSLRRLMTELRPRIIEERGLEAALRDTAREIFADQATTFALESQLGAVELAPELETAVYRVVREALANVSQHAGASHVRVVLEPTEKTLRVTIRDDGSGFDSSQTHPNCFGLLGMRERIQALGGRWSLDTSRGAGTEIVALLPWSPRRRQDTPTPSLAAA